MPSDDAAGGASTGRWMSMTQRDSFGVSDQERDQQVVFVDDLRRRRHILNVIRCDFHIANRIVIQLETIQRRALFKWCLM